MAQYKVPQDVEADDKLIGPFSFRQFVYLLIAGGCIALSVGLFQIFPLLVIIPVLPALFFLILALPIKKDQPMETYLAAIISYYLKPRKRVWTPGQRESTILITAPKIVEETRKRDLSEEEATHRLSFLANIVDTEGQAIKDVNNSVMRDDLAAEANTVSDMFDSYHSEVIDRAITQDTAERHQEAIKEMRAAIDRNNNLSMAGVTVEKRNEPVAEKLAEKPAEKPVEKPKIIPQTPKTPPKPSIMELANNSDFSVATIAKEANRINRKEEGEVFISLH